MERRPCQALAHLAEFPLLYKLRQKRRELRENAEQKDRQQHQEHKRQRGLNVPSRAEIHT
jgi:hypothetical protein